MERWLLSATWTSARLFWFVAAWPFISVPTTESLPPSHQSQLTTPAPMSVALWFAAMPPPCWTNRMIASRCAASQSGPGRPPPAQIADVLKSRIAS